MLNDEIGVVLSAVRLLSALGLLAACGGCLAGGLIGEATAPGMRWLPMADPARDMMATIPSESVSSRHFEIYLSYRGGFASDAHRVVNNGFVRRVTSPGAKAKGAVDRSCVRDKPGLLSPARGMDR